MGRWCALIPSSIVRRFAVLLWLLLEVTVSSAGLVVLQPGPTQGKDIWTNSEYSYVGGSLAAGSGPGGGLDNGELIVGVWGVRYHSLLQFDLTELPARTSSAKLRLYTARVVGRPTMTLHRIAAFWDWRTQGLGRDRLRLWWVDRPPTVPMGPTALRPAILPVPTAHTFYDIDITDLYNAWQSGRYPNHGLELQPADGAGISFASSDYLTDPALRPQLIIDDGRKP